MDVWGTLTNLNIVSSKFSLGCTYYEMYIEGHPVNLEAFGFINTTHPNVGVMRHWNVVVIASKPGQITLQDSGVVDDEPFESTITYEFNKP